MTRLVALAVLFAASGAALAVEPVPKEPKAEPAALRVKKALDETADVVFEKKSLDDVMAFFKNRLRIEMVVEPGFGLDTTDPQFTITSRNAKYKDALRTLLAANGLSFAVVGGSVVIGPEEVVLLKQLRQVVSLDAKDNTLASILKNYADDSGANIVLDPRQAKAAEDAKLTLKLDDVPLETAVRLASEIGGLRVVRMNNVLFVTSDARADKLRPDADGPATPSPGLTPGFGHNLLVPGGGGGGGGAIPPPPVKQ